MYFKKCYTSAILHFIIMHIINQIIKVSSIISSGIFINVWNIPPIWQIPPIFLSGFHCGLTRFSWAVHTYKGLFPSLISSSVIGSCLLVTYRSNLEKRSYRLGREGLLWKAELCIVLEAIIETVTLPLRLLRVNYSSRGTLKAYSHVVVLGSMDIDSENKESWPYCLLACFCLWM